MFNFFHRKPEGTSLTLKLSGLHCSSCSLNIDNELEDLEGVIKATTSYAKQETKVIYNKQKINPAHIIKSIESLGYQVLGV